MLIIGAKGLAKEVLAVLDQADQLDGLAFFDDVSDDLPSHLYGRFPVLRDDEQAKAHFRQHGPSFALGLGVPKLRHRLALRFQGIGGILTSTISVRADIGRFGNAIGDGSNIMTGTVITNDCTLGTGCLVNLNCTIGHDAVLGDWCELSPGVHVSGHVHMGDHCTLGTGAVVLPRVQLGSNVTVGAGAVVTRDVPDNSLVVGVPGRVIKSLPPVEIG